MNYKIPLTWFIFIVTMIGVVIFSLVFIFFIKIDLSKSVYNYYYTKPALNLENSGDSKSDLSKSDSEAKKDKPKRAPKRISSKNTTGISVAKIPQEKNDETLLPIRLQIPKIKIDGAINSVGLTLDNAMEPPYGPNGLGWYKFGTYPGEVGSAVIDGHFGTWKNGQGSIFDNLHKLTKGDFIYIKNADGSLSTFVVRELKSYYPEDDAYEVFISDDGKSHLNLITCTGEWIKEEKTYTQRLVVFADKI